MRSCYLPTDKNFPGSLIEKVFRSLSISEYEELCDVIDEVAFDCTGIPSTIAEKVHILHTNKTISTLFEIWKCYENFDPDNKDLSDSQKEVLQDLKEYKVTDLPTTARSTIKMIGIFADNNEVGWDVFHLENPGWIFIDTLCISRFPNVRLIFFDIIIHKFRKTNSIVTKITSNDVLEYMNIITPSGPSSWYRNPSFGYRIYQLRKSANGKLSAIINHYDWVRANMGIPSPNMDNYPYLF